MPARHNKQNPNGELVHWQQIKYLKQHQKAVRSHWVYCFICNFDQQASSPSSLRLINWAFLSVFEHLLLSQKVSFFRFYAGIISGRFMYYYSILHSYKKKRITWRYSDYLTFSLTMLPSTYEILWGIFPSFITSTITNKVFFISALISSELSIKYLRGMECRISVGNSQFWCW